MNCLLISLTHFFKNPDCFSLSCLFILPTYLDQVPKQIPIVALPCSRLPMALIEHVPLVTLLRGPGLPVGPLHSAQPPLPTSPSPASLHRPELQANTHNLPRPRPPTHTILSLFRILPKCYLFHDIYPLFSKLELPLNNHG